MELTVTIAQTILACFSYSSPRQINLADPELSSSILAIFQFKFFLLLFAVLFALRFFGLVLRQPNALLGKSWGIK
jgi:hypothetical protein